MTGAGIELESAWRDSERADWPPTRLFLSKFDSNSGEASREPGPEELEHILLRICYLFVSYQLLNKLIHYIHKQVLLLL